MKKWLVALLGVLFFAPAVFADNWGLGLKLGVGENDPKTMKDLENAMAGYTSTELDENNGFFGLEAMYEWSLNEDANKLGVKLGFDIYGENEVKVSGVGNITENTYAFPLTVYYKRDNGVQGWSPFVGAGLSLFRTDMEATITGDTSKVHKTKVAPHLVAGAEYRFTKVFALGVEAKYTFSAKIEKDGEVYSDRTGLSGALTGRFYF